MPHAAPPACPRCAYDLSGAPASWQSSCPITGTCSECGLTFDWPDLLRTDRQRLPWLFEHASGFLTSFRAAWRTWRRTLFPRLFWGRAHGVQLHHPVVPWKLLLWPFVLALPLHAAGSLVADAWWASITAARPRLQTGQTWRLGFLNAWTHPVAWVYADPRLGTRGWRISWLITDWPRLTRVLPALQLAWPTLLLLLPFTRRHARVRTAHLLRATIYSLWWVPVLALLRLIDESLRLAQHLSTSQSGSAGVGAGGTGGVGATGGTTGTGQPGRVASWFHAASDIHLSRLLDGDTGDAILAALAAWTAWWWYWVIVHHWNLRRGRAVWATLLAPVFLIALMLTVFWRLIRSRYVDG